MAKIAKNKPFLFENQLIKPGEQRYIELPLPSLYTHSSMHLPVHIIHGKKAGAKLFISAAVHGDEINGVEIIRRILHLPMIKRLKGTLLVVPVVNVYGFINKSRYLPDRRDLNRSFPGSVKGSMASKLAHLFLTKVASYCDYGIDLHTAAIERENLPQIRAVLDTDDIKQLALSFAAPVVLNAPLRQGSLRQAVGLKYGTKVLLYEAGEALRFNEIAIRGGVNGIINVMRHISMLPTSRKRIRFESAVAHSSKWIRAPQSGIFRSTNPMGQRINKGDTLGYISDPFGSQEQAIIAPVSGMVIGKSTVPLVHEGEAIYHIALFDALKEAETVLESFHHHLDPADASVQKDDLHGEEDIIY